MNDDLARTFNSHVRALLGRFILFVAGGLIRGRAIVHIAIVQHCVFDDENSIFYFVRVLFQDDS